MRKVLLVAILLLSVFAFSQQDAPSTEFVLDSYLELLLETGESSDELNEIVGFERLNGYYISNFEYVVEINLLERFTRPAYGYNDLNPSGFPTTSFTPFGSFTCSVNPCFDIEVGSIQNADVNFKFRITEKGWQFDSIIDATFNGIQMPDNQTFESEETKTEVSVTIPESNPSIPKNTIEHLVFTANNGEQIFRINLDGSGKVVFPKTHSLIDDVFHPKVSPNGQTIIYMVTFGGISQVATMDIDGNFITTFDFDHVLSHAFDPSWSPDGEEILFNCSFDGREYEDYEICKAKADGTELIQLTDNSVIDLSPRWSPDGTKIAFSRLSSLTDNDQIYIMNADGSGQRNIFKSSSSDSVEGWSPDGTKIIFSSSTEENLNTDYIYTIESNGSSQNLLTTTFSLSNNSVVWLPGQIFFKSGYSDKKEIYVINEDGTNQKQLALNDESTLIEQYLSTLEKSSITPIDVEEHLISLEPEFYDDLSDLEYFCLFSTDGTDDYFEPFGIDEITPTDNGVQLKSGSSEYGLDFYIFMDFYSGDSIIGSMHGKSYRGEQQYYMMNEILFRYATKNNLTKAPYGINLLPDDVGDGQSVLGFGKTIDGCKAHTEEGVKNHNDVLELYGYQ